MEAITIILFLLSFLSTAAAAAAVADLSLCLLALGVPNFTLPSTSYDRLLNISIRNLRFAGPTVAKPLAVILPCTRQQLQSAVRCCRRSAVAVRVRSGGHSYEGLSYTADCGARFAVVDLLSLNRVAVDPTSATAWVEAGATLGEVHHAVQAVSGGTLAFSAGSCSTVGSGGHIAGGGFGFLSRKYGLAADNVVDAVLIDPTGRVLDRRSMGEDVFWAIRGGGGGNWGVVYAYRVRLNPVQDLVTRISLTKLGSTLLVAGLVHKWQLIAPRLPDEFYLSASVHGRLNGSTSASFTGLFFGRKGAAVQMLDRWFPELGVTESDFTEMSWIDSVVYFAGLDSVSELLDRGSKRYNYFKAKSDYVRSPIPLDGLIGAVEFLSREPKAYIILDPYGGIMSRIRSDHIPFPHRSGNLYSIQYMIVWGSEDDEHGEGYVEWLRGFYAYMEPLVSKNPRAAYVNYVDLDLGTVGSTNRDVVDEAREWGEKYFLGNFDRLVRAKTVIDKENVFRNAQSIPPWPTKGG